jgi:hypothetical protein
MFSSLRDALLFARSFFKWLRNLFPILSEQMPGKHLNWSLNQAGDGLILAL